MKVRLGQRCELQAPEPTDDDHVHQEVFSWQERVRGFHEVLEEGRPGRRLFSRTQNAKPDLKPEPWSLFCRWDKVAKTLAVGAATIFAPEKFQLLAVLDDTGETRCDVLLCELVADHGVVEVKPLFCL